MLRCLPHAAIVALGFFMTASPVLAAGETPGIIQLQKLFLRLLEVAGALVFIALTVMLVVAGIKFLTSGGEAKPIQSASLTMTWAILGILFLALAWISLLLIKAFTGADVTSFSLMFPTPKP